MEFEGAGILRGDDVNFGRGADSNEAEAAIFLRGDFFAGGDEAAEGLGMVERADVTDGEVVGVGDSI